MKGTPTVAISRLNKLYFSKQQTRLFLIQKKKKAIEQIFLSLSLKKLFAVNC